MLNLSISRYIVLLAFIHSGRCTKHSKDDIEKIAAEYRERHVILNSPEDVGAGHTKVIHNLQLRLMQKLPSNKNEYLREVSLAMSEHICDPFDVSCNRRVMENIMNLKVGPQGEAKSGFEHLEMNLLRKDFDPIVMKSLEKLFFAISLADLNEDPTDVLHLLRRNYEDLKYGKEVTNEKDRMLGLLSYSVGMESTKQWHEIFNDEENPFSRMRKAFHGENVRKRNLQIFTNPLNPLNPDSPLNPINTGSGLGSGPIDTTLIPTDGTGTGLGGSLINFGDLLEADVIGVTAGLISSGFDLIVGDNSSFLGTTLEQASLSSANQIIGDLTPENPADCLFPGTILCPDNNNTTDNNCLFPNLNPFCDQTTTTTTTNNTDGSATSEAAVNQDNPQNCLFPNSPFCNTTVPNPDDAVEDNGCLFPNSPFCNPSARVPPP